MIEITVISTIFNGISNTFFMLFQLIFKDYRYPDSIYKYRTFHTTDVMAFIWYEIHLFRDKHKPEIVLQ